MKPDDNMTIMDHRGSALEGPQNRSPSILAGKMLVWAARLITSPWFSFALSALSFLVFLDRMTPDPGHYGSLDYQAAAGPAFAVLTFAMVGWVMIVVRREVRDGQAKAG